MGGIDEPPAPGDRRDGGRHPSATGQFTPARLQPPLLDETADGDALALEEPVQIAHGYVVRPGDGLRGEGGIAELAVDVGPDAQQEMVAAVVRVPSGLIGDQGGEQVDDMAGQPVPDGRRVGGGRVGQRGEEGPQHRAEAVCRVDGGTRDPPDVAVRDAQHMARQLEDMGGEPLRIGEGERPRGVVEHQVAPAHLGPPAVLEEGGGARDLEADRHEGLR